MKSVSDSMAGRVGITEILPMIHSEIYETRPIDFTFQNFLDEDIPLGQKIPMGAPIQEILFLGGYTNMGELSRLRSDIQNAGAKSLFPALKPSRI